MVAAGRSRNWTLEERERKVEQLLRAVADNDLPMARDVSTLHQLTQWIVNKWIGQWIGPSLGLMLRVWAFD